MNKTNRNDHYLALEYVDQFWMTLRKIQQIKDSFAIRKTRNGTYRIDVYIFNCECEWNDLEKIDFKKLVVGCRDHCIPFIQRKKVAPILTIYPKYLPEQVLEWPKGLKRNG